MLVSREQAVLWAGLHQVLAEGPETGASSLEDVERRLVVALLSKAAVAADEEAPLQFSRIEAEMLGRDALPSADGEVDEDELIAMLYLILEDEALRQKYEILLRALTFAVLETTSGQLSAHRGGNLRRLLALEDKLDAKAEALLQRLLAPEAAEPEAAEAGVDEDALGDR